MHSEKSLVHKDLKTENIMMNKVSLEPILLDFGISETQECCQARCNGFKGTIAYCSPEVFSSAGPKCTPPRDMWAIGVVLYLLVYGSIPFSLKTHRTESELIDAIKGRQYALS